MMTWALAFWLNLLSNTFNRKLSILLQMACMWNLQNDTNELIYKTEMESHM